MKKIKIFYDYLLTNLLLYFDKFEDELTGRIPHLQHQNMKKTKMKKIESRNFQMIQKTERSEDLDLVFKLNTFSARYNSLQAFNSFHYFTFLIFTTLF